MNRFAELLDRLAYEPGRNDKLRLMTDYFRSTPDPDRGWALAALTGALVVPARQAGHDPRADRRAHRSGAVRAVLRLCRRPLRDGRADVAGAGSAADPAATADPSLADVVDRRSPRSARPSCPAQLARWLDALDETGRWALLKLVTGGLRIGVSARLAKTAAAALGDKDAAGDRADLARPRSRPMSSCSPGSKAAPTSRRRRDPAPFRPAMLAHALEDGDLRRARSRTTSWPNGNGTASACRRSPARREDGRRVARLYSRTGEDISGELPRSRSRRCGCPARSTASC